MIKNEIVEKIDHRNLNEDVEFMKGILPSIENMIVEIWNILESKIQNGKLHHIKLVETENNYVEYYGE
jgi:6-pyruvoyltetrahydropterin/6-carboxytetrahydropterin synthase